MAKKPGRGRGHGQGRGKGTPIGIIGKTVSMSKKEVVLAEDVPAESYDFADAVETDFLEDTPICSPSTIPSEEAPLILEDDEEIG